MLFTKNMDIKKAILKEKSSFYFIFGSSPYLKKTYFDLLCKQLEIPFEDSFNVQIFSGENIMVEEIQEACEMMPLFSEKKYVILKDSHVSKWKKEKLEELAEVIQELPNETIFIMVEIEDEEVSAAERKWISKIKEQGSLFEVKDLTERDVEKWIQKQVEKRNGAIDFSAIHELYMYTAGDMERLSIEVDKLLGYNSVITVENVRNLVYPSIEVSVFSLTKSIEKGQIENAILLLKKLEISGEDPIAIFSILVSYYTTLFRVFGALEENKSIQEIAEDFNYKRRVFVLENASRQVRFWNWNLVQKLFQSISRVDLKLKTQPLHPFWQLEKLILELYYIQSGVKR